MSPDCPSRRATWTPRPPAGCGRREACAWQGQGWFRVSKAPKVGRHFNLRLIVSLIFFFLPQEFSVVRVASSVTCCLVSGLAYFSFRVFLLAWDGASQAWRFCAWCSLGVLKAMGSPFTPCSFSCGSVLFHNGPRVALRSGGGPYLDVKGTSGWGRERYKLAVLPCHLLRKPHPGQRATFPLLFQARNIV